MATNVEQEFRSPVSKLLPFSIAVVTSGSDSAKRPGGS